MTDLRAATPEYIERKKSSADLVAWVIDFIFIDLSKLDNKQMYEAKARYWFFFYESILPEENELSIKISDEDFEMLQTVLHKTFDQYLLPILEGNAARSPSLPAFRPYPDDDKFFQAFDGDINFCWVGGSNDVYKSAEERFLKTLSTLTPISINSFRKCKGCGNYFYLGVKKTRQSRQFCTRACNSRYNAKRRREADPETYNRKQRELMKQRYHEKKKAESGDN